ncbi:MAG: hypothetical protein IKQ06_03530 [Bacilli bacterium]|nr:hypothetical protein [Bacilli bacterium]MBR6137205.1 hypothetical protein [Bacilli bacterium]
MRKKKKSLAFMIALVLLFLGIGYAYLTTTLSINGVTDVDRNVWDVYFDNIQVTSGSVTGTQVIDAPEIGNDDVSVSFHVNLKEPGEFYEFTIDAKNDGTIDAMIDSISKKLNGVEITTLPAYLNYTVTYSDGMEIENNHMLLHEDLETYSVRVEYRNDINPSDLPSTAQSLTLSFTVNYVQANSNGIIKPDNVLYTVNFSPEIYIGSAMPSIPTYTTYQDAMAAFYDSTFFLKSELKNNIVINSYVGFLLNDNLYYLKAGGATRKNSYEFYLDSIYFEANKAILEEAYGGASHCSYIHHFIDNDCYRCDTGDGEYYADVCFDGFVAISDGNWGCSASGSGSCCGAID